jgi:hypothetical protein
MAFTKVLTIYHSWIHFLHCSPSSPSPIPGIVSKDLIFPIYKYVYVIFLPYPPSYTLSLYLFPSHWYQPPKILNSSYGVNSSQRTQKLPLCITAPILRWEIFGQSSRWLRFLISSTILSGYTLNFFFFLFNFYCFIIHMCIQCLGHFSPMLPPPPLPPTLLPPSPPHPLHTQQKLFALISNFVEERV